MKFGKVISSLFVCVLLVIAIMFTWSTCNKGETENKNTAQSNFIVLSLSDVETVEEDGITYLDRVARPSISETDYLPEFGFSFNAKWAEETDKNLEDYFVITNDNGFTCTLRVIQKFEEDILFEIITQPEGYYGAFIITYEGAPTAIEGLPSEVQLKAGTTQKFDLFSFNPLNPDASEQFNDFMVSVKYFGAIKTGEYLIVTQDEETFINGSEKIYSDLSKLPGIKDLFQVTVTDNVLTINQTRSFSNNSVLHIYDAGEHELAPCATYEKFMACLTAPYAEVTVSENTSGYVQKIKVWMEV